MLDSKDGLLNRLSVVPVSRRMVVPGRVLCVSEEREVTRHEVLMMAGVHVRQGSQGFWWWCRCRRACWVGGNDEGC